MNQILSILNQILQELRKQNSRPDAFFYFHFNPPHIIAKAQDGFTYKINPDGKAFLMLGQIEGPIPCNPYPEVLWKLNLADFVLRNRNRLPLAVLTLLSIVALQFLLSATVDGYAAHIIPALCAFVYVGLFILALLVVIGAAINNFNRGRRFDWDPDRGKLLGLLPGGETDKVVSLDLSPDLSVFSLSETETSFDFADRQDKTLSAQTDGQYIVIVPFRFETGLIVCPSDEDGQRVYSFPRHAVCDNVPGWFQEVATPRRWDRETWRDYQAYLSAFCDQLPAWSRSHKLSTGDPLNNLTAALRKTATTVTFLLCAFFAFAQGSVVPVPDKFLTEKERTEAQTKQSVESMRTAMRNVFSDSVEVERLKQELILKKSVVAETTQPVRSFCTWVLYGYFFPVLAFFAVLFWLVANAAFGESIHDPSGQTVFGVGISKWGHIFRAALWSILTFVAVVEMARGMLQDIISSNSLWWWFCWWVIKAFAFFKLINWIVPNPKVRGVAVIGQQTQYKQIG